MSNTVAFLTCSALVAFLNIAPFCWQVEHRNSGVASLGFWVIVLNLVNFVRRPFARKIGTVNLLPAITSDQRLHLAKRCD